MGIFKAYDVRGKYGPEINEALMKSIGRAFADFISGNTIAVGRDMRLSSFSLFNAFCEGIIMQGKNVLDFGLTSTPMAYFACRHLKADGCAMITASHNPKEDNGVKFTRENAIPISEDTGIREIEKSVTLNSFHKATSKGRLVKKNVLLAYQQFLQAYLNEKRQLKIVVDGSSGMGAQDFGCIKERLKSPVRCLSFDLDGNFPDHDANPMKEGAANLLIRGVLEQKADLGIIFDGDADRVFFVDNRGRLVASDMITALISVEILKKNPGKKILYDLRSSWVVREEIEEAGGRAEMCRVGHSFIKDAMRKTDSIFAGEISGHFYFRDAGFIDSGIITAIYIINILSSSGKRFSDLLLPLQRYFVSGEINSTVSDKEAKMKEIAQKYGDGKISYLDGIRIDYPDFWFNVRPSNTEPLLRLNVEGKKKEIMEKARDDILKIIRS